MAFSIRMRTARDSRGYKIERGETTLTDSGPCIVGRGGDADTIVLEGADNKVCEALANCEQTEASALAFVSHWGHPIYNPRPLPVALFNEQVWRIQTALGFAIAEEFERLQDFMPIITRDSKDDVDPAKVWSASLELRYAFFPGRNQPQAFIEPQAVWMFAFCEMFLILNEGGTYHRCENCNKYFSAGYEKGTRRNRRFCSDKCRAAAHRKRALSDD